MSKKRVASWATACLAAAALAAAFTVAAGAGRQAGGLGSSYDVASAGKATLTIWWLGNQEIPGIEAWMKETIAKYQKLHPNVHVKTVLQGTNTYTTQQKTGCKGGTGPDIWYNWGGTWSLEMTWAGCAVPNEEALSPADLKPVPAISGTKWSGKTWVYPIEQRLYPIIYNKDLFKQAGLDASNPPQRWAQFLAASTTLKKAKIQAIVTGLKDGFGGENLAVAIQRQVLSEGDLIRGVVDGNVTSAKWKQWIARAADLKPFFNNDVNSLTYSQGLARFQAGKAAMIFASPGWQQMVISMNASGHHIGIFKVPVYSPGANSSKMYEDTPGFQVTKFAKNKALAGNFLAFTHTPERMAALYNETGDIPSDLRWKPTKYKSPTDKQLIAWLKPGFTYYSANYYPTDLDVNGNFVVFQGLYGGQTTPSQAVATYQKVLSKWRRLQAIELQSYKQWLKDFGK